MIHRQVEGGGRVVVVTFCTADPPPGPLSEFAQGLHERWRPDSPAPAAEVVAVRRREDLAALDGLGAQAVHLDIPDCIYRLNPATGLADRGYLGFTSSAPITGFQWDTTAGGQLNTGFTNISVGTAGVGVPEPATWTLMLAGFGGLGAMLRRRRAALAV